MRADSIVSNGPRLTILLVFIVVAAILFLNIFWAVEFVAPLEGDNQCVDGFHALGGANMMGSLNYVYPPFHFLVLDGAYAVTKLFFHVVDPGSDFVKAVILVSVARLISALMGLGGVIVFLFLVKTVYKLEFSWGNLPAILIPACLLGLNTFYVFYSHTINPDVPYLFWWFLSLLLLFRSDGRNRGLIIASAVCCAFSVASKDQAGMLYPVLTPFFFYTRNRFRYFFLFLGISLAAYFGTFLLYEIVHHDAGVFSRHLSFMDEGKSWFATFPYTPAGRAALGWKVVKQIFGVMDLPGLIACVILVSVSLINRTVFSEGRLFFGAAGFYFVTILVYMSHTHARYMLPLYACLLIVGVPVLIRPRLKYSVVLAVLVVAAQAVYGFSVSYGLGRFPDIPARAAVRSYAEKARRPVVVAELASSYYPHPILEKGKWKTVQRLKDWGNYGTLENYKNIKYLSLYSSPLEILLYQPDVIIVKDQGEIRHWLDSPALLGSFYRSAETFFPRNLFAKDLSFGKATTVYVKTSRIHLGSASLRESLRLLFSKNDGLVRFVARNIYFLGEGGSASVLRALIRSASPQTYDDIFGPDPKGRDNFLKGLSAELRRLGRKEAAGRVRFAILSQ